MMDLIREDIEENEALYEALAADAEEREEARGAGHIGSGSDTDTDG